MGLEDLRFVAELVNEFRDAGNLDAGLAGGGGFIRGDRELRHGIGAKRRGFNRFNRLLSRFIMLGSVT